MSPFCHANVIMQSMFFNFRTYHKDSYMTHRRGECLGQAGRYRRTSSPSTSGNAYNSHTEILSPNGHNNVFSLSAKEEFHRSLLQSGSHHEELSGPSLTATANHHMIGIPTSDHVQHSSPSSSWGKSHILLLLLHPAV